MPNRAERRAAERQAQKLAANATNTMLAQQAPTGRPETMFAAASMLAEQAPTGRPETVGSDQPPAQAEPADTISEARLNANRANSQFSTGPVTSAGKAKSSMNAVKTGLTGRTVLLPTDDAIIYQQHLDRNFTEFAPVTDKEKSLVQMIADAEWRLLRIAPLEAGIYAIGRLELADQFPNQSGPANREALILCKIFMTYRKDLGNLALQERRLRSQRKADIAELRQLQNERLQKRHNEIQRALKIPNFDPAALGFDFSILEFQTYNQRNSAQYPVTNTNLDFDLFLTAYRACQKEAHAA